MSLLLLLPAAPSATQEPLPVSPSRVAAIDELLQVMNLEAQNQATMQYLMGGTTMAGTPMGDVVLKFVRQYMPWGTLHPELVRIYADLFNDAEIRELIEFYQTPLGRKVAVEVPVINRRIMELTNRIVAEHQVEFQAMVREAMINGSP